jgi:hypothetical protein
LPNLCIIGIHDYDIPREAFVNGKVQLKRSCLKCPKVEGEKLPPKVKPIPILISNGSPEWFKV